MSTIIRLELSTLGLGIIYGDYHYYHSMVTSHGLIMIFGFIMPITLGAIANYALPLLIGLPDLVFPRLNNLSMLLFSLSILVLIMQFELDDSAATG